MKKEKIERRMRRRKRIRNRIFGIAKRPRISVFRSNKHIFAQVINDEKGETLVSASDLELDNVNKKKKSEKAKDKLSSSKSATSRLVGELLAKKMIKKRIKRVAFDRSGFRYHGRIQALAEGLRKGGIDF